MIISKVSRSRVPSELRCKAQADLEKTSWKEVDINTRRTPSTDISHPYSEIIALSVELVKFNFSTTRPTSRTPSTIVLPHLLLKLIEDELDYNVVLHLQQFRRPLGDPGLQNIQLDLSERISNSNISLVETWTLSSSASSSPKLQFMEKCGGNVSGQHE